MNSATWESIGAWAPANTSVQGVTFKSAPRPKYESLVFFGTDDLDKKSQDVLGISGVSRFEDFKTYPSGWDHGKGRSLSLQSVAVMQTFLNRIDAQYIDSPSLFFTRAGNLQLGWEDGAGNPVEIEFFPDRIDYFFGATQEEGSVSVDHYGLNTIISTLQQKKANAY